MKFSERLKEARKRKGLSQSQLAKLVGIHVTNISRYERGENRPTSEALTKLADVLGITVDYLMSGSLQEMASDTISDKELLTLFRRVENLPDERKMLVKEFLDAFLLKNDLRQHFAP